MVGVNMFMILSFILVGSHYVDQGNWHPFIPVAHPIQGIMMGAF